MTEIPRILYQIWIGPYDRPVEWMDSWKNAHPGWRYVILDNDFLNGRKWRLQPQMDEYLRRGDWAGVSDMMRYEVLLETGGIMMPADAVCLKPVDDLFTASSAYVARENDIYCPESLSPVLAAPAGHPALALAIEKISQIEPKQMATAWLTNGNLLMGYLARLHPDFFTILSSKVFVPRHYSGIFHIPDENTYAFEHFGSTGGKYDRSLSAGLRKFFDRQRKRRQARARRRAERRADPNAIPWLNMANWPDKPGS